MESKFIFNSTTKYIYHCNTCQHNLICYTDEKLEKEYRLEKMGDKIIVPKEKITKSEEEKK